MTRQTKTQSSAQETRYLLSIPGMRESIRCGLTTPVAKCRKTLLWQAADHPRPLAVR